MAIKPVVTNLNASTYDILNVIRANASAEYQSLVPKVEKASDIPRVGEIMMGYPQLQNQFLSALVNRIALVRVKSATFNNAYTELKKGYLEFGETVEEVFVSIAKAREFNSDKGEEREFKRSLPDVKSAFHAMNWRVQYPVTISDMELRTAFLSLGGVQDLIAKIVDTVYTANEYDEYLLFKYLMIKAITGGKAYPVAFDSSDMKNGAVAFRGTSNALTFMSSKYNASGVHTSTPKDKQYIFMDSDFNARFDVEVLASAFNMGKADFVGRLKLIDDWTTFDNDRFSTIMENSDMIEPVTAEELALMANVKAVLCDEEWFQIYDNLAQFTEKYVASGMYWNYFYNVWKTISSSPFSNFVVFVDNSADIAIPETINMEIASKSIGENATVFTLTLENDEPLLHGGNIELIQNEDATGKGIAIHPYGAVIFPTDATSVNLEMRVGGVVYKATTALTTADTVGTIKAFTATGQ